jgi:hypothetical protein
MALSNQSFKKRYNLRIETDTDLIEDIFEKEEYLQDKRRKLYIEFTSTVKEGFVRPIMKNMDMREYFIYKLLEKGAKQLEILVKKYSKNLYYLMILCGYALDLLKLFCYNQATKKSKLVREKIETLLNIFLRNDLVAKATYMNFKILMKKITIKEYPKRQ